MGVSPSASSVSTLAGNTRRRSTGKANGSLTPGYILEGSFFYMIQSVALTLTKQTAVILSNAMLRLVMFLQTKSLGLFK